MLCLLWSHLKSSLYFFILSFQFSRIIITSCVSINKNNQHNLSHSNKSQFNKVWTLTPWDNDKHQKLPPFFKPALDFRRKIESQLGRGRVTRRAAWSVSGSSWAALAGPRHVRCLWTRLWRASEGGSGTGRDLQNISNQPVHMDGSMCTCCVLDGSIWCYTLWFIWRYMLDDDGLVYFIMHLRRYYKIPHEAMWIGSSIGLIFPNRLGAQRTKSTIKILMESNFCSNLT